MTARVRAAGAIMFVGVLGLACSRADHPAPPPSPPAAAVASPSPGRPTASPPNPGSAAPAAPGPAAIVPLASGKRLRLEGVGGTDPDSPGDGPPPLEITVPPKFALKMHRSEEELPSAHLRGAGLEVVVEAPESGFTTLAESKASLSQADPSATFPHAAEDPEGHLLVYRAAVPGVGPRFGVVVSRPRLKVDCGAHALSQLSDAERVASICLTLRAAPDEPAK